MKPNDSLDVAPADPRSSLAPPYVDEDPEAALVQQGLDEAENETRNAVADDYEASALLSDDVSEALDDIDYSESEDDALPPEIAAIHEEFIPLDEDDEDE
jgi:predicted membrane-bound mannosyltransferase